MKTYLLAAGTALGLITAASPAGAVNIIANGGFETTTNGVGQMGYNTNATGWTTSGYNFVFPSDTGATVQSQYGGLSLYAPSNGYANGFTASPDGGNFIGADGAFSVAPVLQTITGLTAGHAYTVSFYWGGAQQNGFSGTNTEQWEVKLGNGPSQFTSVYTNSTAGFSGWMHEAFSFTADNSTQVLSFLAHGTPDGVPPFSVLDGVSMNVPEPATWVMLICGFGLVGAAARRRRLAGTSVAA